MTQVHKVLFRNKIWHSDDSGLRSPCQFKFATFIVERVFHGEWCIAAYLCRGLFCDTRYFVMAVFA